MLKLRGNYKVRLYYLIGNTTPAQSAACQYLTLVGELCGGDVQLLKLLLELGEVSLQPGVLQLGLIQLALELLVIRGQQLIVVKKLTVCLVQP